MLGLSVSSDLSVVLGIMGVRNVLDLVESVGVWGQGFLEPTSLILSLSGMITV